jgi:hypothetical protein
MVSIDQKGPYLGVVRCLAIVFYLSLFDVDNDLIINHFEERENDAI